MRKFSFWILLAFFISSCSNNKKTPRGILPPPKMQEVLWDMIQAGEFLNAYVLNKDSIARFTESSKVYGQVFQLHKITKEQFDKSYSYYRRHPELMNVMMDSLSKKQLIPIQVDTTQPSPKADTARPSRQDSMRKRMMRRQLQ